MNAAPRSSALVALRRQDREARRRARPVLEDAVAVPVRQAEAGQQPPRGRRVVVGLREVGRIPPRVARRDRPVDRDGRAEEHRLGERARDRPRARWPPRSSGLQQPRALGDRRPVRPQVHPERVGVEADAEVEDGQLLRVRLALQRRVVLRAHLGLREVDLPGLQRQELRVLVGDDLEREPVEHRQRLAALVLPPVARVPLEDEALARLVRLQHERPEADDLRRRRGEVPGLGQRAGVQRRLQLVARQDRQVVEQPDARAEGRREAHDHRGRVRRAHGQRLAADAHRLAEDAAASSRRRSP